MWTHYGVKQFIVEVIKASKKGSAFVPLIGSGMSAPSGIMMGSQFRDYLGYVVIRILKLLPEAALGDVDHLITKHWDIRKDGWPEQPKQPLIDKTAALVAKEYKALLKKLARFDQHSQLLAQPLMPELLVKSIKSKRQQHVQRETLRILGKYAEMLEFSTTHAFSPTTTERVTEYAIRCLHDWRATLHCISRIRVTHTEEQHLAIGDPDSAVIDSFNAYIVSGRRPAFGHTLLAHLSEPLRFRTLLTTNFDGLLEEAFHEAHRPLRVIEISTRSHLPAWSLLRAQNSLVKLHGGLLETRADLSLDEVPAEIDCNAFSDIFVSSHLLVLGYSANDLRTVRLIKAALERNTAMLVYWVCHCDADRETIAEVFTEASYRDRMFYCVTSRSDLLLYELYQKLTLCLPGGGISHNYAHRVPPDFTSKGRFRLNLTNRPFDRVIAEIQRKASVPQGRSKGYLLTAGERSGVSRVAERLFGTLRTEIGAECVWLDLMDFEDAYNTIHEFLRTIALRRGVFQLEHLAYLIPLQSCDGAAGKKRVRTHLNRLCQRLAIFPQKWWLFLYGRDGSGGCATWHRLTTDDPNGGGKPKRRTFLSQWSEGEDALLRQYLHLLTDLQFNVVFMPMSKERRVELHNRSLIPDRYIGKADWAFKTSSSNAQLRLFFPPTDIKPPRPTVKSLFRYGFRYIRQSTERYLREEPILGEKPNSARNHLRFLYALTLFRQSRNASALCMDALCRCGSRFDQLFQDNDADRMGIITGWVEQLIDAGILYEKPDGALWMFGDMRANLSRYLAQLDILESRYFKDRRLSKERPSESRLKLSSERSRMHFWIADWYRQAFYATSNHLPLIEGLFHYFESALSASASEPANPRQTDLTWYKVQRFEMAVASMTKVLILARPWLKFWMQTHAPSNMFANLNAKGAPIRLLRKEIRRFPEHVQPRLDDLVSVLSSELRSLGTVLGDARNAFVNSWQPSYKAFARAARISSAKPPLVRKIQKSYEVNVATLAADDKWHRVAHDFGTRQFRVDFVAKLVGVINGTSHLTFDALVKESNDTFSAKSLKTLDSVRILGLAEFLGEFCYLIMRRARVLERCQIKSLFDRSWDKAQCRDSGVVVQHRLGLSATSLVALTLASRSHPAFVDAELALRVKIYNLYGLTLAQLGRFYEANRRFDLILGQLSKMSVADDTVVRLRTELRKAETMLLEARQLRRMHADPNKASPYKRQLELYNSERRPFTSSQIVSLHAAKLDDAYACLESAYSMLSGRNYSALWWGYYINLHLECYAEMYPLEEKGDAPPSLILRRASQHEERIKSLLTQGILTSPNDPFTCLCLLESAIDAMRGYRAHKGEGYFSKAPFLDVYASLLPVLKTLTAPRFNIYLKAFADFFAVSTAPVRVSGGRVERNRE